MRGIPFRVDDADLTDIDLWLYERPTGTSRRVQICDIKYKQKPKAIERIFWTSGLAGALKVDGAYVATTDDRALLRSVAAGLELQLIDGTDINRIRRSSGVLYPNRIGDEELKRELASVDRELRSKFLHSSRNDILTSVSEGFGAPSTVRALEVFGRLAGASVRYHPGSHAARAAGRLAYLAAAVLCVSVDYVSIGAAFRSIVERRELIVGAVRLGALSGEAGQQRLKLAIGLVEKFAPSGKSTARAVEAKLNEELSQIPAEIIADEAVKLLKSDQLFFVGRELEMACYDLTPPPFDALGVSTKSMLGAMLDYSGVDRGRFANAWKGASGTESTQSMVETEPPHGEEQADLFGANEG